MQKPDGKSFPSGHVLASFTFWNWFLMLKPFILKEHSWWQRLLLKFPPLFIILIGPARIYLGDHWASDVLGGYLLSSSWFCLSLRMYLKLKSKRVLA
ncbi:MAG: phosphatase PAP2 family protein [Ktedonobacteraceae bacterium]|nr:phosphatase PAP2 family protein [Ktedonobacteraceae bacterium]